MGFWNRCRVRGENGLGNLFDREGAPRRRGAKGAKRTDLGAAYMQGVKDEIKRLKSVLHKALKELQAHKAADEATLTTVDRDEAPSSWTRRVLEYMYLGAKRNVQNNRNTGLEK